MWVERSDGALDWREADVWHTSVHHRLIYLEVVATAMVRAGA